MPTHKWSDIKYRNMTPEQIERIKREVRETVEKMRFPPFAYDWAPGDRGCLGTPEEHGLEDGFVDVVEVEPERLLVSDGGRQAWVPREQVGRPEDFGVVDDDRVAR